MGSFLLRAAVASVLLLGIVACSNNSDGARPRTTEPSGVASPLPADAPDATGPLPNIQLSRVFPSLQFARMTGLYQAPDGRWFALEQAGRIFVFDDRQDAEATLFLDIRDRVQTEGNEEGLLGFALAADFATSGNFYVDYVIGNPRREIVSRFNVPGGRGPVINSSEAVLLQVNDPFSNHNGGQIAFGPDGYLYIGIGDGGSGNDPQGNGQNTNAFLGKILRIDVRGTSSGRAYAVPSDNPFVGRAGSRDEIYAYGFRNPWRFSFDRLTGALWVGDVGQNTREEVDVVTKGGNYGWNITEGFDCRGGGNSCSKDGLIAPVLDYPTGADCAVTGGFVYRGSAIQSLTGAYVFGDYCSGKIWGVRYDGKGATEPALLLDSSIQISSFAEGNDGDLYALQHAPSGGGIFKITR